MEGWYLYILVGLACGVFSATFGVGSGILMIPILVLAFATKQKSAQGICLAVMVPMALVGAIRYQMNPKIVVDMKLVGLLTIGGVVGALIGARIAAKLHPDVLRRMFAIVMIIAAVRMLIVKGPKPADQTQTKESQTSPSEPGRPETETGYPDST
jgi:hypothetical protein